MSNVKFLKCYVVYTLCAGLAGFTVGLIQGAILGFILGIAGVELRVIPFITGITGFITGSIVGFFIFRWAIRKYIFNQIDIINTAEQADPTCPPQGAGFPDP